MNLLHRRRDDTTTSPAARVPGPLAAAAVGLVCAVLAIALVLLGERGCDLVWGTPSCGGAGVVLLVLISAAMLGVGLVLLRLLAVADPAITNLLGFSLFVVVLMTALLDQIFSAYMWIVLPLLGALSYAAGAGLAHALARISEKR